jgi:alkanesulfonate monooxygenase SsuD/methylene tetrahydromethanopterin reductase-like flavin-dependent oxidoreductase (luciferase family)
VPDLGRELTFGWFLVPDASAPLVTLARDCEARGLDWLGIQDHPYQRRFVDTWALMGVVLGATARIGVFPDVACLPLRPPALMAKTAASLDLLSGGRFELGMGAGAFWDAIEAYGGPRRTPGAALAALDEAIEVIRKVWSGERNLRFAGTHYSLAGAQSGPVPAHDLGIWLGVYGPRALRLCGRVADGWVPSFRGEVAALADMTALLDNAAAEAGRDPSELRRVLNVNGTLRAAGAGSGGPLDGPVEQWVDELADLALSLGFDTFVFGGDPASMPTFAEEVAPAARAQVAQERTP